MQALMIDDCFARVCSGIAKSKGLRHPRRYDVWRHCGPVVDEIANNNNNNNREPQIMRNFLHRWPRKTGCVTLLIALTVASLWVRSLTIVDYVSYSSSFNNYTWASCNGLFYYTDYEHGKVVPPKIRGRYFWEHRPITVANISANSHRPGERWGVYYLRGQGPRKYFELDIRYSSIVIPLTILSSVLLLSKQRKRKAIQPNPTAPGDCLA